MSADLPVRRRALPALAALAWLVACSGSGPEQAEALAMIAARIRSGFGVGEKRLQNLVYQRGSEIDGGRYAVFVDYDLVSLLPEMGLFNTTLKSGETSHIVAERYVFVRSNAGWALE